MKRTERDNNMYGSSKLLITAILLFAVVSCDLTKSTDDADDEVPGDDGVELVLSADSQDTIRTIHDDFLRVAALIPDFGGFFFNEEGHPSVWLLSPDEADPGSVEEALREVFGEDVLGLGDSERRAVPNPELMLLQGDYSVINLLNWFEALQPVMDIDGVVFTEMNEGLNRILVGVVDEGVASEVDEALQEFEINREAVEIRLVERDEIEQTLRSEFRPVKGGIQIRGEGSGTCTYGITGRVGERRGFVTNSHCTRDMFNATEQLFGNPNQNSLIGVEAIDRSGFTCGRNSDRTCRYSDAAFIEPLNDISRRSAVARTEAWGAPGNGAATLDIDQDNSFMSVIGSNNYPFMGQMVDKIGRTTGWTYGFVTTTCSNRNPTSGGNRIIVDGAAVLLLCQYAASYHSAGGDSGSPVFLWQGNVVVVTGLHWGSGGTFSPFDNLLR